MSKTVYQMPLVEAIRKYTLAELVTIFSGTSPAFLAGIVKAKLQSN